MINKTIKGQYIEMCMEILQSVKEKLRKANDARVEVGLFKGLRRPRSTKGRGRLTNADLGLIHEFGSTKKNIPERSFLRMPLMTRLFGTVKNTDWLTLIHRKGLPVALALLGEKAKAVIHQAFKTGGWGQWAKLKKSTVARKGHDTILIETGQMEGAIDSRVVVP